jgi:hypothetical protein
VRHAERRVADARSNTIACPNDQVTTTFNKYRVYLSGKPPEAPAFPTPENIAR